MEENTGPSLLVHFALSKVLKLVFTLKCPAVKPWKWEVGGWDHIKNPAAFL